MRLIVLLLIALGLTVGLQAAEPQRIVSTAPSITETLFAMGLGPRVVGVTIYCKFPPEVLKLPKIGTYLKPDIEAIIALHPDLVVVQKQPNQLGEELSRVHIRYVEVQSENLNAVYAGARTIGQATGANAGQFVQGMRGQLESLGKLTASRAKPLPTVAFIVGHTAGSLEGLSAGSGTSYFSDLLNYAGASNIFANVTAPYPRISLEELISRNPDVILELAGDTTPKQQGVLALWQGLRSLKAVSTGRVYAMPSEPFLVPGPRAVEAVKILVHLLHPELQP